MHELSMAEGILKAVIEKSEDNNATEVIEVVVEIGKMVLINPEQIKFLLDVLSEDTIVKGAIFTIEEIPIEIDCPECEYKGKIDDDELDHYAPVVNCPKCGNKRLHITNGKDCIVKNIIIEQED
ncbi:hydrogenase maturation nickel metallochaperone HypA [Methanobrevibacter filiformis]|uniref:Hydrogenase maturation factor HypA n=1 Tax=Methanobrevibacter filiformis TaxID=55758 RepID=A0A162FA53_9EURY|nr:hydrogenase maturation nickel metallochaperone HypA [Methanobrevibacter filiformis]KZX10125.1 hydrogenase nickel incorporation protein HypA [Methanobrevibacter filiformis]